MCSLKGNGSHYIGRHVRHLYPIPSSSRSQQASHTFPQVKFQYNYAIFTATDHMLIVHMYIRLCIMHHTLPNRDVYSIYQTDRDDQGTMCRGHNCHSFGHKVHAFTHADITPSGAFLPRLSVSWDRLLPNREPTCLQGNAHGS